MKVGARCLPGALLACSLLLAACGGGDGPARVTRTTEQHQIIDCIAGYVPATDGSAKCVSSADAVPATWSIDPATPPTSGAKSFDALVMRVECSGGVTGEVYAPTIEAAKTRVVVTFRVAPLDGSGAHTCPGNRPVPYTVRLDDPIGDRALVDGSCDATRAAIGTAFCADGGVRWES
jgi:hypothetical protein